MINGLEYFVAGLSSATDEPKKYFEKIYGNADNGRPLKLSIYPILYFNPFTDTWAVKI